MKKVNPFLEKQAISVDSKFKDWNELNLKPYDKQTAKPYTKARAILMNGTEFEQNWFLHRFYRCCNNNELRKEISNIRRREQQQQKQLSALKPIDETNLETTIAYEQLAVDLTAVLAMRVKDDNIKNALNFALLEDFDHLYRYANLLEMEQGIKAEELVGEYTEIMPGRPTIAEHRHPRSAVNPFICNLCAGPFDKLATNIITAAEQQTMNYYMNIASFHGSELGRKLYTEIAMIEEQHVSEYGSLLDTNCTWLENWLMHEYTECYLYYSCYLDETDENIKNLYENLYYEECGHLQKVAELLKQYEGKDWFSLFPCGGDFPEPLKLGGNIEYIRHVLGETISVTRDENKYVLSEDLSPKSNFKTYNKQVNGGKNNDACHEVIENRIKACGEDYRYQKEQHPVEELQDRKKDNTTLAR